MDLNRARLARREARKQMPREVRFLTLAERNVWVEGVVECVMARKPDQRSVAQVVGAEIDRWMSNPANRAILNVDALKNQDPHAFPQLLAPTGKILHALQVGREYAAGKMLLRSPNA